MQNALFYGGGRAVLYAKKLIKTLIFEYTYIGSSYSHIPRLCPGISYWISEKDIAYSWTHRGLSVTHLVNISFLTKFRQN